MKNNMTQEEKAKAYDKLFIKAKQIYNKENDVLIMSTIEDLFPQIKESEDERISKEIMDFIYDKTNTYEYELKEKSNSWLAWLEKQNSNVDNANKEYWRGYREGKQEVLDKYAELEKQGERKPTTEIKSPEESLGISSKEYNDIVNECLYGETMSANKIELKFKVGDWIVNRLGNVWHIDSFDNKNYKVTDINGNHKCFPISLQDRMHLWTIQDAKPGDVLFQDLMCGKTFIYNGVNPDMTILYSFIISNDGKDVLPYHIGKPNTGIGNIKENKNIIYTATKEQRDLLFSKMKEAGYEWDEEKKELKKIK